MAIPQLVGVIPPILTPFTSDGDLDERAHIVNLGRWNSDELAGYLVLGSNGEAPYLSEQEKLRLIGTTVEHAAKGRTVLAGTGLESTRETIRLTNIAAELGAHAALIITPAFFGNQMNDDALVNHYRRVADASRIPILLYNVPAYTRLTIAVDAVQRLSSHPNIAGMKDSSGDIPRLETILKIVPETFQCIVGSASAWFPALKLGVRAGILALSNFAGNSCALVQRSYTNGDMSRAEELHQSLVPVNAAVTSVYGVPGLKYASSLLGYQSGYVRSPLTELNAQAKAAVKRILETAGLL